MKPLTEGFRVYSRSVPVRELRPPKSSLAKATIEGPGRRRSSAHAWKALAVLTAFGVVLLAALN